MGELVKWDEIQQQIDIIRDINVLKKYHAALASKEFRKQIDGSIQAINKCEKYKIKIEIAFGEYYQGLEDKKDVKSPSSKLTMISDKQQAETEIGKSRETINKYARMSSIEKTDELLEQYESKCNDKGVEMSSMGFIKFAREEQHKDLPEIKLSNGKFNLLYVDPPWKYGNTMPIGTTSPADYYPAMSTTEICNMPIKDLTEDNAVLFLWTTSPHLEESFQVINSWGFKYKASFIWDKVKHNMGHYNSVRHELLLICIKGSYPLQNVKLYDSVYSKERTEHSKKPEFYYNMIEDLYPNSKKIELFSRKKREGWISYGNQL